MKEITCKNGEKCKVDDDMYEVLSQYVWLVDEGGYAYTFAVKQWGFAMPAMMHHCIIGRSVHDLVTDHANRDKRDNRRENLRHVSTRQNQLNSLRRDGKEYPPDPCLPAQWVDRSGLYQPYHIGQDWGRMPTDDEMADALDEIKRSKEQGTIGGENHV